MPLDLERMAVLFVEDNPFIRSLMASTLKLLGVGTVLTVAHGGEAIELLETMKREPIKVGVSTLDIIISNWDMSPVDGPMLLRYIRRHKDSPDRFIPFIFLTGYTEIERVEEARDLGVHEIISKPFTVRVVSEKLTQVITKNRQFVHSKDYFGPDRRRHTERFAGRDRRFLTDRSPEVEVLHG